LGCDSGHLVDHRSGNGNARLAQFRKRTRANGEPPSTTFQPALEQRTTSRQATTDSADRASQPIGRFFVREALHVAEHNRGPEGLWQSRKLFIDYQAQLET
jgi:hypothetical protein